MGQVEDVKVDLPHPALADADWADCYAVDLTANFETALDAANAIIKNFPKWTYPALVLRQALVMPFGLKGSQNTGPKIGKVGIFPIISEDRERIVAGFDDKHLNFRIVVDISKMSDGQRVSLATIIKRHNLLGRGYLLAVLPVHRAIIRGALGKL